MKRRFNKGLRHDESISNMIKIGALVSVGVLLTLLYIIFFPSESVVTNDENCSTVFEYFSSDFEELWIQNGDIWQEETSFCEVVRTQKDFIDIWIAQIGGTKFDDQIFSRFEYTETCGTEVKKWTSYIEPLAAGLRDPRGFCFDKSKLLSREWIQIEQNNLSGRKIAYFDVGASKWESGLGGASQKWFYDAYNDAGAKFTRFILWEAIKHDPVDVLKLLPKELMHAYQYFNIPATTDITDPSNPVNVMKQIRRDDPEIFIAFKLDMDNPIETQWLSQFGGSDVNEFFFEHHVKFSMMEKYWRSEADQQSTYADSARIFLKMRQSGIRAHSWP